MITVETIVNAPIEEVWKCWNEPEHIKGWAFASDDWEAPKAENDLRTGGTFVTTMAAKDGNVSFDLKGAYTEVKDNELIEYTMEDGRKVKIVFEQTPNGVKIVESFDPENENPEEMQRQGWQAILDNFKKHTENHG
jgi:uncharacterized protein YndB with AHSA1/START domain